jgi:hypothetical protein
MSEFTRDQKDTFAQELSLKYEESHAGQGQYVQDLMQALPGS